MVTYPALRATNPEEIQESRVIGTFFIFASRGLFTQNKFGRKILESGPGGGSPKWDDQRFFRQLFPRGVRINL